MRLDRPGQVVERVAQDLDHEQQQEHGDRRRGDGFVLPVAVRMILVGRLARRVHADQAGDVRRRVGQRVEAVGQDADRAAGVAERDLRDRHGQIEQQDANEHARDRRVPVRAEG